MKKHILSVRLPIYPNKTQTEIIERSFSASRYIWNLALEQKKLNWSRFVSMNAIELNTVYDKEMREYRKKFKTEKREKEIYLDHFKKFISWQEQSNEITECKSLPEGEWLYSVHSSIVSFSLRALDQACSIKMKNKGGFPEFKKFSDKQSFSMNGARSAQLIDDTHIKLPKLGVIRMGNIGDKYRVKDIKTVTIKKDLSGKYFVSFPVEYVCEKIQNSDSKVGIDMNLENFLTTSDNKRIENPRFFQIYESKLKKLQRDLSRSQKITKIINGREVRVDSNNRKKIKIKMAKIRERIDNLMSSFLHNTSADLVKENQLIVVEDLNIKNMTATAKGDNESPGKRVKQKAGLNRSILQSNWGKFFQQLEYKSAIFGKDFIRVNPRNTSQLCSSCGHKNNLSLKDRVFMCNGCGLDNIIRDHNAAINIKNRGIEELIETKKIA